MLATYPNWLVADADLHEMSADSFVNCYLHQHLNTTPTDYQAEQITLYRRAAQVRPSVSLFPDPTSPAQVRYQAGVWTRALRLFVEDGYQWEPHNEHMTEFYVYTPCRTRLYRVDMLQDTCTCAGFERDGECKHRLALARLFGEHVRQYALARLRFYTND